MKPIDWCCVTVIVDDDTTELFDMPAPDEDAEQQPAFRATKSTVDMVSKDFARYEPSLERMVQDWRKSKEQVMQDKRARNPAATA